MNEASIIERYLQPQKLRSDVLIGIGDDAAVVESKHKLVMSLDSLVVDRHFRMQDSPADIAYKALATNLSDLAAMGATPCWAMLSLSLPSAIQEQWIEEFMQGFFSLAKQWGVSLIGGDLVRGPLVISIQITGQIEQNPLLRSTAKVDDVILMTGDVGGSGVAWHRPDLLKTMNASIQEQCNERLLRPIPRIKEGQILQSYANAAIDISDGVFLDLTRILNASKLGAKLNLDQVALNPAIASIPLGEDWLLPYMSGDDYELIFTINPDRVTELKSAWKNAKLMTPLSEIGRITEEAGLQCFYQGKAMNLPSVFGFDHFSEPIK